jgi:hypothetical protein
MRRAVEDGRHYIIRQGKRIEVVPIEVPIPTRRKMRKAFEPEWVKLPRQWIEVLRKSKSTAAWCLAHMILLEAFKCQHTGGEIVLSSAMAQMPKNTRIRAAKELVELGLIRLHRSKGHAHRVIIIST